jgi:subtilisin family serine protease
MRLRGRVAGAATAVLALTGGAAGVLSTSAPASAQDAAANHRVIVVYNNQDRRQPASLGSLAARRATFRATRAPVLAQMRGAHSARIHSYALINATSATVTPAEEQSLKGNPRVAEVIPDQIIRMAPVTDPTALAAAQSGASADVAPGGDGASSASACSAAPQLEPEALSLLHADSDQPGAQTARSLGFTGAGVTVGFIADGLDINNPDFIRNGKSIFTDYKDFSGEGTGVATGGEEAFGDASSIAAQGNQTYSVNGYGPNAQTAPCNIKVEGVAPGANLVGLDVFGAEDSGFNSVFLNAINYAVTVDHVNVLNESLGENTYPDDQASLDLIKAANDAAVAAGVSVTASSGDAGVTSTIGSPSTDPNVISVGATTSNQIDLQDGYGGAQFPGITGYQSNDISSFSSGGYEMDGRTVDVVGPGELGWAVCSTDTAIYSECVNYAGKPSPIIAFGGTSESAPLTAGVAALVDQAYAQTHGTFPSPTVVKQIITSTASDINSPAEQQGAGLVNAYQAVLAAESYKAPASAPTPQGSTLLKSAGQLNVVDQPGTKETLTDTVTNNGSTPEHISLSGRQLGAYTSIKNATVTLSDTTSPKTTDWAGVADNYEPVTFSVPSGQDRLNVSAAFQTGQNDNADPSLLARVRITLVDPSGNLTGYSVPQGDGNYGNIQVTDPAPGTWTAYIWSRTAANSGTTGPVLFGASVAEYQAFGTASPSSLTLAPGASEPVTLSFKTPRTPGDTSASLVLAGTGVSAQTLGTTTVPVTIRSLIPSGKQSFDQTLTGGNGREVPVGQEFYYELDAPAGQPELNATVTLADNPNNPFTAFLVGPNGNAQAMAANALPNGSSLTNELGAQLHVLDPAPGAWTLIVAYAPTVSGTALAEPFTVSTSENAVPAKVTGGTLPDSASTKLKAGKAATVGVKVTNTGSAPEEYFLDGRLSGQTSLALTSLTGADTVSPFTFSSDAGIPEYLVPTDTTALSEAASTTGSTPFEFDTEGPWGDPDIESTAGTSVTASYSANPLAQGEWSIIPEPTSAFGTTGTAEEPVTTSLSATTAPFDPAVSSPTGDLWQASIDPDELESQSPVVVGPGRSATIPVTIKPKGKSGTKVSGTLYVDDENDIDFTEADEPYGNQVAAIPYAYTIK